MTRPLAARWTLRARLTVLYGGLFVLAGAILLAVTYLLVQRSLDDRLASDAALAERRAAIEASDQSFDESVFEDIRRDQEELKQAALDSLLTQGGLALLGVGVLAGAAGWVVAGRALRPVGRITATAHRIARSTAAGRGLHERIALTGPEDEVKQLADTFDEMLEHLDRSFDGQRRFVANASHELRTPLALNRALVELAITRPDAAEETKQLGTSLLTVNDRHERLIDGLLTLADSENALTAATPVDLSEVVSHVLELAESAALEAGVTIRSTVEYAATYGDPELLERLVFNLVDNAVHHNSRGGRIVVDTATAGDSVTLEVSNTGPVVPVEEAESIFQPFRRLGTRDRTRGTDRGFGLGLSIVRAIARAHGGDAVAVPRAGGGLTVTVTLPSGG